MSNSVHFGPSGSRHQQMGVSLLVVLILLLVMSFLGIAVLRSSGMQERMSANMRDRSLAFQAAETALREAQEDVLGNAAIEDLQYGKTIAELREDAALPITCATHGICDTTAPANEVPVAIPAADGISTYTIEYLGNAYAPKVGKSCNVMSEDFECWRPTFRVTARGRSPGLSEVFLQANVVSR